jgi:hypothetical protein
LPLGLLDNFPVNVHRVDGFTATLSVKQLQQKLLRTLQEVNCREFSFDEVTDPTVPQGTVLFEFGIAEGGSFSYLDEEMLETVLSTLSKEAQAFDFFCVIRYYKISGDKKTPLKFDYYMLRTLFGKDALEVQVFHERGPRYVSPEDLTAFIVRKLNAGQRRKILSPLKSL